MVYFGACFFFYFFFLRLSHEPPQSPTTKTTYIYMNNDLDLKAISNEHFEDYLKDDSLIVCPYQASESATIESLLEILTMYCLKNNNQELHMVDFGSGSGIVLTELSKRMMKEPMWIKQTVSFCGVEVSEALVKYSKEMLLKSSNPSLLETVNFICCDFRNVSPYTFYPNKVNVVYAYLIQPALRLCKPIFEELAKQCQDSGLDFILITNEYHPEEWSNWTFTTVLSNNNNLRVHRLL